MINFDNCTNENKTEHNPKWPYIPDHPYRILIVGIRTEYLQNTYCPDQEKQMHYLI